MEIKNKLSITYVESVERNKMSENIAIVTIDDSINYGNRLQNYAMQEYLKSFGYKVSTIHLIPFKDFYYIWSENKKYCIKQYLYSIKRLRKLVYKIKGKEESQHSEVKEVSGRKAAFAKFNDTYIQYEDYVIRTEPIEKKVFRKYQYIIAGSDQVWNPTYGLPECAMYLRFVPKKKRIAIAASFGISEIPTEHLKLVQKYLKGMNYISVREESGKKIVKDLTGKDCDLILDPTLLVSPDAWKPILGHGERIVSKQYVLTYFLGNVSEQRREYIEEFARKKGLEIIWMNEKSDQKTNQWGPECFLRAIHDCAYFFTDSFHGCVFSILFHRQFYVFYREDSQPNMFGRIDTLLETVNLKEQIIIDQSENLENKHISDQQFKYADAVLEKEREKTGKILKNVLKS